MSKTENSVVADCFRYAQLRGAFVWRNNSRTVMVPGKGGKMRPMFFGLPGSPDIIGVWNGRAVGIECKRPLGPRGGTGGSVQTPEQVSFQREFERAGGLYVLARSSQDVERAMDNPGVTIEITPTPEKGE